MTFAIITMKVTSLVLWVAIAAGLTVPTSRAAVLIKDGKARAQIVIADTPSRVASDAAALVRSTLRKMTGAELPIVRESAAGAAPSQEHPWIATGDTRLTRSGGIDLDAARQVARAATVASDFQ